MVDDDKAGDDAPRDIFGELVPVADTQHALTNDLVQGLANVSMTVASAGGSSNGLPFLGISKRGRWHYGVEGVEVDPMSTAVMNLRSFQHGYIAWADGKPTVVMVPINQPLPPSSSLPPVPNSKNGWEIGVSVEVVFVSGKDKGAHCLYQNNSDGARQAAKKLAEVVQRQLKVDPSKPHPIIKLETTSYDHPKHGEIIKPVFTVIGFTDGRSDPTTAPVKTPSPAPETVAPQPETAGVRRRRVG